MINVEKLRPIEDGCHHTVGFQKLRRLIICFGANGKKNPSSRKIPFYYFSTTFGGRDLPHFAAFCRVMNFILEGAGQK